MHLCLYVVLMMTTILVSAGRKTEEPKKKKSNFSGAASGILGQYRVPAMLLVGGAYGGVFALPLSPSDTFVQQIAKRTYIVIGVATVAGTATRNSMHGQHLLEHTIFRCIAHNHCSHNGHRQALSSG